MMAVLGEKIDALLGHPFRQVSVLARRHSHQGLEFRVQALKQFVVALFQALEVRQVLEMRVR